MKRQRSGSDRRRATECRRYLLRGLLGGVLFALGVATYAAWGLFNLTREARLTPRDASTGVVIGVEARDLGPTAADGATSACLLLHGFVGSRQDFGDLGERLAAAGLHVREARLPGHGTTPGDFADQSVESMYAGAADELRKLKEDYPEVSVVGFSMGGTLATLLAEREGVDRLVLAAPYYGVSYRWYVVLPAEWWNTLIGWAIPYVHKGKTFVQVNRREAVGQFYAYKSVPTRGVKTLIALGREARRPANLKRIHCPVLLVMSKGDGAASPRQTRKAFDQIGSPDKRAQWFTASNHHLFWDYERAEVIGTIIGFLAGGPKTPDENEK